MSEQKQNNWFFNVMVDTINKWLEDYMSPVLYISDCLTERVFTGEYKGNGHASYSEANVITRVEWILNYKINKKEYSRLILSRSVWYSGKVIWYLTQGSILNKHCLLIEENKIHMYDKAGDFPIFDKDSIMDLMGRLEDALFFESYVKSFDKEGETIMGQKLISQETLQTLMRKWLNSVSNHDTWIHGGLKGLFSWTLPHATGENGKGIYARLCEESFGKFWKIYQNNEIHKECIRVDCNGAHTMERSGNFETFSVEDIEKLENMINDEINNNEEETTMSNNNEEIKTKEMSEDMRYLTQPTRIFRPTLAGLCIHVHAPNLDVVKHAKIRQSLNLYDEFNNGSDEYSFNGIITAVTSNGFKIEGQHAHGSFRINIQDVISGLIQLRLLSPANEDDLKLMNDIDDEYRA